VASILTRIAPVFFHLHLHHKTKFESEQKADDRETGETTCFLL